MSVESTGSGCADDRAGDVPQRRGDHGVLSEISLLFRGVFGDAAMVTRVRPVLMSQLGNGKGTLTLHSITVE